MTTTTTLPLVSPAWGSLCLLAEIASSSPDLPSPADSPSPAILPTSAMEKVAKLPNKDLTEVIPAKPFMPTIVAPPREVHTHLISAIYALDQSDFVSAAKILCSDLISPVLGDGNFACLPALLLIKSVFLARPTLRLQYTETTYALEERISCCLRSFYVTSTWEFWVNASQTTLKESATAIFLLGYWTEVVKKDVIEAANIYQTACLRGSELALAALGTLYSDPTVKTNDKTIAYQLLKKAAKRGHASASYRLACIKCDNSTEGVNKRKESYTFLRNAAKYGHLAAQRRLASDLLDAVSNNQAAPEAISILKILAKRGCGISARILYNLYIQGHHVKQDCYQALQWQHLALLNKDPLLQPQPQPQQSQSQNQTLPLK